MTAVHDEGPARPSPRGKALRKLSSFAFAISAAAALVTGSVLAFGSSNLQSSSSNTGDGAFGVTGFQGTGEFVRDTGSVRLYVPGNVGGDGVDTGIAVTPNDTVTVSASGVEACGGYGPGQGCTTGPDGIGPASPFWGQTGAPGCSGCDDPAALFNELVGVVGTHPAGGFDTTIGHTATFTPNATGDLYLTINDTFHADNQGGFSVDVQVNGQDAVPAGQPGTPVLLGYVQNTSTGQQESVTGAVTNMDDATWLSESASNTPPATGSPEQVCHDFLAAHPMLTAVDWSKTVQPSGEYVAPLPGTAASPVLNPPTASTNGDTAEWAVVLGLPSTGSADVAQLSTTNTTVNSPCVNEPFTYDLQFQSSLP